MAQEELTTLPVGRLGLVPLESCRSGLRIGGQGGLRKTIHVSNSLAHKSDRRPRRS